jgi:hypothetical protein
LIQATHKGAEIELESHQEAHGQWTCDYTLIMNPDGTRTRTTFPGKTEFPTKDLADEHALQEARDAIDRDTKGKPESEIVNPPRQVRV